MRTYFDCVPCLIRQAVDMARRVTDDAATQERIIRRALQSAAEMDLLRPPPVMAAVTQSAIRELTGVADPYAADKARFNSIAADLADDLRELIATAPDPLETAVRLAIAGNIIDFGVAGTVPEEDLQQVIDHALTAPLPTGGIADLRAAIAQAERILYIGDNAGEIFFDRLLLEQLPLARVTFCTRGGPILNDITRADAEAAGIPALCAVIDTGRALPGAVVDLCSPVFQAAFAAADVVIAKGQGNYETLNEEDKSIFFLLKVKCPMVAAHVALPLGSVALLQNSPRG